MLEIIDVPGRIGMAELNICEAIDDFIARAIERVSNLPATVQKLQGAGIEALLVTLLNQAGSDLDALVDKFEAIKTHIDTLLSALNDSQTTLAEWEAALGLFGISLTVATGLDKNTMWGKGISPNKGERAREAYTGVTKVIKAIARTYAAADGVPVNDNYRLKAIARFLDSFGGIELRIVAGSDVDQAWIYARTTNQNLLTIYDHPNPLLQTDIDAGRDYALLTAENLVHEFGHLLDFRTGGAMYPEWEIIRREFGRFINCGELPNGEADLRSSLLRGFDIGEGWNISFRQNRMTLNEFTDCYNPANDEEMCDDPTQTKKDELCQELEIERIADMFLFWVYRDNPGYAFTSDDRGQALQVFTERGHWTRGTTSLTTTGFSGWIESITE